ncbi:MAG: o-succinylbenzoate synthase [Acidobacteriota bacterium]|nr:o-succinylbenzoate synthase [Acidobacteriota bacterium]
MSIHLASITLHEIRLPLVEPFTISSGTMENRRILLLELCDADGITAWSESVADDAPNYNPETVDTCRTILKKWLAPRVLGKTFADPGKVDAAINQNIRGHHMAKAALEMGCWGLEAERQGKSLSVLLGGIRETIITGISIGIQPSPAMLVKKARGAFAQGYPKIKCKIRPGADLAFLAAVREELGPDAEIMADANNAYTIADFDHLVKMDAFGLLMLEQPLAWDDVFRHAELQRRMTTPICLDESITSLDRAEDMIALKAGRIINIKPGRVGGFTASKAIHDLAEKHDIPVWCGGMLESGIGRAYNVALASLPNFKLPGDLSPSARYWAQDIVRPEWTMSPKGEVTVPRTKPGLGIQIDRNRIDNLTVRSETLTA